MATVTERRGAHGDIHYRAQICCKGVRKSATFDSKEAAFDWARRSEEEIKCAWPEKRLGITTREISGRKSLPKNDVDVPFEFRFWNATQCAQYFLQTQIQFVHMALSEPGFPKHLKFSETRVHLWRAIDVVEWAIGPVRLDVKTRS